MAIAQTIVDYLVDHRVDYHVYPHDYTECAIDSAKHSNLDPCRVAKAVVVATKNPYKRNYCLVVLPSNRELNLQEIRSIAFQEVELASEPELAELFPDCEIGAVPALGEAYGLPTFIDETVVTNTKEVFFEAGDHVELISIATEQLEHLMPYAELVSVCKHERFQ